MQGSTKCAVGRGYNETLSHHSLPPSLATQIPRPFPDVMPPDDRSALFKLLAVPVLSKNPHYSSSLRLHIRTVRGDVRQVDARFRFSALGVACSLWTVR